MHIRHSPVSRSGCLVLCIWLIIVWYGGSDVVVAQLARGSSGSVALAATIVDPTNPPIGINIALAALGGRIVKEPSTSPHKAWRAEHLHDGTPAGWASADRLP